MFIYNFEFGTETVNWGLKEFKSMDFIGTDSIKFYGNNNFLRVNDKTNIEVKHGTYYDPAIIIPNAKSLQINATNMHISTLNDDGIDDLAAIITLENKNYRLVKYSVGFEADKADCQILKQVTTPNHRVLLLLFDGNNESVFTLILFNNTLKRYEYWTISHNKDGKLVLKNLTGGDKEINKALEEFETYDKKNKCKSCKISLYYNFPMTYYVATTNSNTTIGNLINDRNYKIIRIDDKYKEDCTTKEVIDGVNKVYQIPKGTICLSLYEIKPNDIHKYKDENIKYILRLYNDAITTDF